MAANVAATAEVELSDIPDLPAAPVIETAAGTPESLAAPAAQALHLDVVVNAHPTGLIAAFRAREDGSLAAAPDELREVGLKAPDAARGPDGLVSLALLPGVAFAYDEAAQTIHFQAEEAAREPRTIPARSGGEAAAQRPRARSGWGAVVNYAMYATVTGEPTAQVARFSGVSTGLDARLFSPHGVLAGEAAVRLDAAGETEIVRLDTAFSRTFEDSRTTAVVGDAITGGLAWTRPFRIGGVQVRRNFGVRSDLISTALPDLSGTAAVPSTVDVFANGGLVWSGDMPPGPFTITDVPVPTGRGDARMVVRDALGREVEQVASFFATDGLLARSTLDFSLEAGWPRRSYGSASFDYDDHFAAAASARYGLSDRLTLEGHVEGSRDVLVGGAGATVGLGAFGVGSVAFAGSRAGEDVGALFAASLEVETPVATVRARTQRTFGEYRDVVSASALSHDDAGGILTDPRPPSAIDQIGLHLPPVLATTLGVSFTATEDAQGGRERFVSLSLGRKLPFEASLSASGFVDLDDRSDLGGYVGVTVPLGRHGTPPAGFGTRTEAGRPPPRSRAPRTPSPEASATASASTATTTRAPGPR